MGALEETLRRICQLQTHYNSALTPEMKERGVLLRGPLVEALKAILPPISAKLGRFGDDAFVQASDGVTRKTELPWVRVASRRMSPKATDGFYIVIHFSTNGTAVHITVGCGSSQFRNGAFVELPAEELEARTQWARSLIEEELGTLEPFTDPADFGATRKLPKSFERATALCKTLPVNELEKVDIPSLMIQAAEALRIIYASEEIGRGVSPADFDEKQISQALGLGKTKAGQGYGLSADQRKAVELRAMELAKHWLEIEGYDHIDKSANNPFDLEAIRGEERLKIEVKGTTSQNPSAILMTKNEVNLHQQEKGGTGLLIVSGIHLATVNGKPTADGGSVRAFIGWDIDDFKCTATMFRLDFDPST